MPLFIKADCVPVKPTRDALVFGEAQAQGQSSSYGNDENEPRCSMPFLEHSLETDCLSYIADCVC